LIHCLAKRRPSSSFATMPVSGSLSLAVNRPCGTPAPSKSLRSMTPASQRPDSHLNTA
jgi:hypothetical protein